MVRVLLFLLQHGTDHLLDENLVVKKMGLFAVRTEPVVPALFSMLTLGQTVFQRYDGTESYYFNSQLFNKFMYVRHYFSRRSCTYIL